MWRFWLGLPADGCRLAMWLLGHALSLLRRALVGVLWLVLPSGIDRYEFPTAHFLARTAGFSILASVFARPHVVGWMMEMRPDGSRDLATLLAVAALSIGALVLAIVNLAVAAELRRA